ncbi:DUF6236 family protein [Acetobacter orientalis]|uniref:DUF6236 family protein n=1 Tax=Acetobacter orientalis TaxID=146474 RepID=UPI0020A58B70|nr:DUF6236 family protein [Acetobacter orientalis]MCP1220396.1 DUF6236 family protein [Acetobacter orientalis]
MSYANDYAKAIFYPDMRINDPQWLRSQLLFFDEIATIDPQSGPRLPITLTEEPLLDLGILKRLSPSPEAVEGASRELAALALFASTGNLRSHFEGNQTYLNAISGALEQLRGLNSAGRIDSLSPNINILKNELKASTSDKYVRMHPEKMHFILRDFLITRNGLGESQDFESWINVDPVFASTYMVSLVKNMTDEEKYKPFSVLTNNKIYDLIYQDITASSVFSQKQVRKSEGIFIDVIMDNFSVDPETPIYKIVKFKEKYAAELKEFRNLLRNLAPRCSNYQSLKDIESEAKIISKNEIFPKVDDLEKALKGYGIVHSRSGYIKAASIVTGMIGGLTTFDFSGNQYFSLGASLALSMTGMALSGEGDKKALREGAPYAYLSSIRSNF